MPKLPEEEKSSYLAQYFETKNIVIYGNKKISGANIWR